MERTNIRVGIVAVFACALFFITCSEGDSRATRPVTRQPVKRRAIRPNAHAHMSRAAVVGDASPTTLAVIQEGLDAADWMTRWVATGALACVPGEQSIAWLERRLADPEEDVRAEAISSLGHKRERSAHALLLTVQNDSTEHLSLRVLAASALIRPSTTCR